MRLALGIDDEESEEAEAGAYLEAETAHDIHQILLALNSYSEATNSRSG